MTQTNKTYKKKIEDVDKKCREIENKIPSASDLVKGIGYNEKIADVENKIPNLLTL